ncbi:hypothetical protein GGR27_002650 [Lewinella antarctica]|uniref:Uncharacterized protein n=1 Tax=Neolewinella antarctica TaxID=442734 RepID=A0ABX0XEF3_9BACT|nr:hypothetical protein [Neolewinella antarctica]NJC27137.1 hypothetical protein [Neolewinella antarctica]
MFCLPFFRGNSLRSAVLLVTRVGGVKGFYGADLGAYREAVLLQGLHKIVSYTQGGRRSVIAGGVEDCGAVLAAALVNAILREIVKGEEFGQELPGRKDGRVIGEFYHFGVAGFLLTDLLVGRVGEVATGESGAGSNDAG